MSISFAQTDLFNWRSTGQRAGAVESRRIRGMLSFEHEAFQQGFGRIAGVDEAGRGPLAGPIVAAAVILSRPVFGLNDSKMLSHEQREVLYQELHCGQHVVGVGIISHEEIDRMGIQQANYLAMAKAIEALHLTPDYLLVDGFRLPGVAQPALRIVKGDQRSLSIAAASIVAKVTRDRIMLELAERYPHYGFERHKGYYTQEHLEALERHGPCAIHRRSFAPIAQIPETAFML